MDSITSTEDYAIFDALKADNTTLALELIEQHKGVNAIDKWGQTPLMIAALEQRYTEIAALLNARRPSVNVNMAKPSGATALFYAVQFAQPMIVQAMLRRGADPNMSMKASSSLGNTPLHFACLMEKTKMAELLLEYGANPNAVNQYGQTPLQLVPADAVRSNKLYFNRMIEVSKRRCFNSCVNMCIVIKYMCMLQDARKKWTAVAVDGEVPKAPVFVQEL
jgi:ankyrin repeat protein